MAGLRINGVDVTVSSAARFWNEGTEDADRSMVAALEEIERALKQPNGTYEYKVLADFSNNARVKTDVRAIASLAHALKGGAKPEDPDLIDSVPVGTGIGAGNHEQVVYWGTSHWIGTGADSVDIPRDNSGERLRVVHPGLFKFVRLNGKGEICGLGFRFLDKAQVEELGKMRPTQEREVKPGSGEVNLLGYVQTKLTPRVLESIWPFFEIEEAH